MKNLLVITFCFYSAICWVESGVMRVSGYEGQKVRIRCAHSNAGSNRKYFCQGHCSSKNILVKTEHIYQQKGRFSLYDHGSGTFTVTITGLKKSDTGKYWCGIERTGLDTYTEVHLTVREAPTTTPQTAPSAAPHSTAPPPGTTAYNLETQPTDPLSTSMTASQKQTDQLVFVAVGLGVAALVFGLTVAAIIRGRLKAGKSEESVYYNVQNQHGLQRTRKQRKGDQIQNEVTIQQPATDAIVNLCEGLYRVTSKSCKYNCIYQNFIPNVLNNDLIYGNTIRHGASA